jgi:uncharacterized protein (TIGR02145 family)
MFEQTKKITLKNKIMHFYKWLSYLFILCQIYACNIDKTKDEINSLSVITSPIIEYNDTSAICGGEVLSDGSNSIIEKGICWSRTVNPTFENLHITSGPGSGKFSRTITVLDPNTQYYIRAYAINSKDTIYGNIVYLTTKPSTQYIFNPKLIYGTVSDKEGNSYKTIRIGNQTWMAQNLRATKFQNGNPIPSVSDIQTWLKSSSPCQSAYSFNENSDTLSKYGRYYNWQSVIDKRNIAPTGWHVATENDWDTLWGYLIANGYNYKGNSTDSDIAKALASQSGWENFDSWSVGYLQFWNNKSGFSALPAGILNDQPNLPYESAYWWSYSESPNFNCRYLSYKSNLMISTSVSPKYGLSVRCVKD